MVWLLCRFETGHTGSISITAFPTSLLRPILLLVVAFPSSLVCHHHQVHNTMVVSGTAMIKYIQRSFEDFKCPPGELGSTVKKFIPRSACELDVRICNSMKGSDGDNTP
jgi:hypothetical protein